MPSKLLGTLVFVAALLLSQSLLARPAAAVEESGSSTRSSDQVIIWCYSDLISSTTYNNPEQTSATISARRYATCDHAANIWFQFELTHTPPGGSSYLVWHHDKNPYTDPGCNSVTYCDMVENFTTTQPGFYQLTSWAHFSAAPDGTPWAFGTKGFGWTVRGPGGPSRPSSLTVK